MAATTSGRSPARTRVAEAGDDPTRRLHIAYDQLRAHLRKLEKRDQEAADELRDQLTEHLLRTIEETR